MSKIEIEMDDRGRTLRLPVPTGWDREGPHLSVRVSRWYRDDIFPPRLSITIHDEQNWSPEISLSLTTEAAHVLAHALIDLAVEAEQRPEEPEDPARSDRLHMLASAE